MKSEIEELHIGENKLLEIILKDSNGDDFDIASLSFLELYLYQFSELVSTLKFIPVADDGMTYEGSILTAEIKKTITEKLKRGQLMVRIKCNNPNVRFTDGEQHVDIDEFTAYEVIP